MAIAPLRDSGIVEHAVDANPASLESSIPEMLDALEEAYPDLKDRRRALIEVYGLGVFDWLRDNRLARGWMYGTRGRVPVARGEKYKQLTRGPNYFILREDLAEKEEARDARGIHFRFQLADPTKDARAAIILKVEPPGSYLLFYKVKRKRATHMCKYPVRGERLELFDSTSTLYSFTVTREDRKGKFVIVK